MRPGRAENRIMRTWEACALASGILKQAGFELANVSMRSEATYYRFPGRPGVIRVATHAGGKGMIGLDNILAKITFAAHKFAPPDSLSTSDDKIRTVVCLAIGRYMVESAVERTPNYDGEDFKGRRAAEVVGIIAS